MHGSKVFEWVEEFKEQQTNVAGDLLAGQPAVMNTLARVFGTISMSLLK